MAHQPFAGHDNAVHENVDIISEAEIFERMEYRFKIKDTDLGRQLQAQIDDLKDLLIAYKTGAVTENHPAGSNE